jgi:hypothetical protein
MPDVLLTDALITRCRDTAGIQNTGVTGTSSTEILRYLTDALHEKIFPVMMRSKQSYFVRTHLITLVSGQSKYRFPPRAVALKLEHIMHRDTPSAGAAMSHMMLTNYEDRMDLTETSGVPAHFYTEGNYIVIIPDQGSTFTGYLEVPYFLSPGELVLSTACRQITAVNTLTREITVATLPTTAATYDIVSGKSGGEPKCLDLTTTATTATTMTFTQEIDGSVFGSHPVEIGDWVSAAETTCVPPLPRGVQPVLVQAAVMKIVEAQGDMGALQMHGAMFKEKLADLASLLADRVESKPTRILGRNGILRR